MDKRLPFLNPELLKSRILWSINLRWLAILGVAMAIMTAGYVMEFDIPYRALVSIWFSLIMLNTVYTLTFRKATEYALQLELRIIFIHVLIDILLLTLLIHFSGGLENPFYLFYFFHILITSILFPPMVSFILAGIIFLLFASVIILEAKGVIPHYGLYGIPCYRNFKHIGVLLSVFGITAFVTAYISGTFMTIYRKIKVQVDKKNDELEQRNIENTKFFNFASHELKSPIIAIKSTLDAISASFGDRIPAQADSMIRRSSERSGQMLSMVTEILDISRKQIKAGRDDISKFNINDLIYQVVQHANSVIQSKNLTIELKLDSEIPELEGTKYDYIQILNNLVFNATYYTGEKGRLTIISRMDSQNNEIIFSVSDTGIGIAAEDKEKIFSEFFRAENAKQEVRFGTGLGLSLVKQLVVSNNGRITVDSELGYGSTFTVHIPLGRTGSEEEEEA